MTRRDESSDPLDRELSQLVDVDPAPGFAARVNVRIRARHIKARRVWHGLFGSGAVLLVASLVLVRSIGHEQVPTKEWIRVQEPRTLAPAIRDTPTAITPLKLPRRPSAVRHAESPPILVDRRDLVALVRYSRLGHSHPTVSLDDTVAFPPVAIERIEVAPLVLQPVESTGS